MTDTTTDSTAFNLDLSEEQTLLRDTVRRFAEEEVAPRAMTMDKTSTFDMSLWAQMRELGLTGVPIPAELGGAGMDTMSYILTIEELARVCGSTALTLAAHVSLCTYPIFAFGSDEQRRKYVPDLASGKKLGSFGLTEPNAGSDSGGTQTTAVRKGDRYVLNGTKIFITNANIGETFIATAKTSDEPGGRGISAFIVEKAYKGFRLGQKLEKLGTRGSDWAELIFEDCEVPVENRVGAEGEGFKTFMKTLDGGRISIGAMALGLAQGAYERAKKYAKERVTFGKRIADHQAIAFKLADMAVGIQCARHLVYHSARLKDAGRPFGFESAMAKLHASEVAMKVTYDAIQVLGGYGYSTEYEVERFWRDAKLCTIGEGTSEVQRLVISRQILK
ncbi:MAG: acyl-CoA dehydrogenase [Planctomycetes bacterium]|nr:acyl-CoA dehydrogenase [Planctomycetota bacterium]